MPESRSRAGEASVRPTGGRAPLGAAEVGRERGG